MQLIKLLRIGSPLLHPPYLSELIQPTKKGKGRTKEKRWWRARRTNLPKKPSLRGGPTSPKQCRRGQLPRGRKWLTTKLQPLSRPHGWIWMELLFLMMPPFETSSRAQLGMWQMRWNNPCYCPRIWLTSDPWGSTKSSSDWRGIWQL